MSDLAPHWRWRFTDADGSDLDRPVSPSFGTQFDAEEWLGLHWRGLREQGAAGVRLSNRDTPVGPRYDLTAVPEQMAFHPVTD